MDMMIGEEYFSKFKKGKHTSEKRFNYYKKIIKSLKKSKNVGKIANVSHPGGTRNYKMDRNHGRFL
jgi:hypothetical protein